MENILEKLEKLKKEKKELSTKYRQMRTDVIDNLNNLLICYMDNFISDATTLSYVKDFKISDMNLYKKESVILYVRFINFKTQDYVFGSDFEVEISNDKITINNGTIGTYGKDDNPYVVARDYLKVIFWENDKDIINFFKNHYDFELDNKLSQISCEIDEVEWYIKNLDRKAKEQEVLSQLVVGAKYQSKEDGEYYSVISKITPKRVYYSYYKNGEGCSFEYHEDKIITIGKFVNGYYKFID